MTSTLIPPPLSPASPWQRVLRSGVLRCAVPRALGGDGADLHALALKAQALGDHLLEDLLTGERTGSLDRASSPPLVGTDTGRGWLLNGQVACAPIRFEGCFFREDEWLGGPELTESLFPVSRALGHPEWPDSVAGPCTGSFDAGTAGDF